MLTAPQEAHPIAPDRKAETARRNGALSRGPVTPEGKARAARNSTRHGLCAKTLVLGADEGAAALAALRAAMLARHQPVDEAEAHWVEELVAVAWRQRRLRALEDAVLVSAAAGEADPALPSLATVIRYRGRLDRDWRRAVDELALLRRGRTALFDPAQLRTLAPHLERGLGGAGAGATTSPPELVPCKQSDTNELPPAEAHLGTNEPTLPPSQPAERTNELPPSVRVLNRHQRRRLAALARLEPRRAA
jgi:hypothetical protein